MNRHWKTAVFAAVDLEGTSKNPWHSQPCEIGCVTIRNGHIEPNEAYESFIPTRDPIPPEATAIHGITKQMTLRAPQFARQKQPLTQFFWGKFPIGHSPNYDFVLLQRFWWQCRFPLAFDTYRFARNLKLPCSGLALDKLVEKFNLRPRIQAGFPGREAKAHRALYDAFAAGHLFIELVTRYMPDATIQDLAHIAGYRHDYKH